MSSTGSAASGSFVVVGTGVVVVVLEVEDVVEEVLVVVSALVSGASSIHRSRLTKIIVYN